MSKANVATKSTAKGSRRTRSELGAQKPAPSFRGLRPASSSSANTKQKNFRTDTRPELLLRRYLWAQGARYRVNVGTLPGKPDLVFSRQQLAVFCDGDFWHGREWKVRRKALASGHNASYWLRKITYNIDRDRTQEKVLRAKGWTVIRIWESDIKKDLPRSARSIIRFLHLG